MLLGGFLYWLAGTFIREVDALGCKFVSWFLMLSNMIGKNRQQ